jgi:hypothetical protein
MRNPRLKPLHLRWTLARMEARCARMARRTTDGRPMPSRTPIDFSTAEPCGFILSMAERVRFDGAVLGVMAGMAARLGKWAGARKRSMFGATMGGR